MPKPSSNSNHFMLITFILTLALVLNIFVFHSTLIGLIFGFLYLTYFSLILAELFFADSSNLIKYALGFLILLCLITVLATIFYYLLDLTDFSISLVFVILPGVVFVLLLARRLEALEKLKYELSFNFTKNKFLSLGVNLKNAADIKIAFLIAGYLLLALCYLYVLFQYRSFDAIRSPWEVVPTQVLIIYALLVLNLILTIFKNKNLTIIYPLVAIFFFITFLLPTIIYQIGYGFDPFIHQASEKIISETGAITPKTFYYIGQYSLVVLLAKMFSLSSHLIDRILLPLLSCVFLPAATYFTLRENKKISPNLVSLLILFLLLLPLNQFLTLPQNFANLLLIILVILSYGWLETKKPAPQLLVLIGLAIIYIHPLTGLSVIILLTLLYLSQHFKKYLIPPKKSKITSTFAVSNNSLERKPREYIFDIPAPTQPKRHLKYLITILLTIIIPTTFWCGSVLLKNYQLVWHNGFKNLSSLVPHLKWLDFYSIYHLVYLYKFNALLIFLLLVIYGLIIYKNKTFLHVFLVLIINIFFLQFLRFTSFISYEQSEFTQRLLTISLFLLTPYFLIGLAKLVEKVLNFNRGSLVILVIMVSLLTFNLYLMFPRVDAFEKARGYSTSQYDLLAVKYINEQNQNNNYVVLANQAVAAAAIKEYGFKKYYPTSQGPLFYYPVPTGSPLYQIYLDMVYDEPKEEYINKVRELTGVNDVYFVINDYWLDAKKRVEQAQQIAEEMYIIDDKIWIFKFN